jgi:hypothetical protein
MLAQNYPKQARRIGARCEIYALRAMLTRRQLGDDASLR